MIDNIGKTNDMFDNVGKVIKSVAKIQGVLLWIITLISAIVLFKISGDAYTKTGQVIMIMAGVLCLLLGPFLAFISGCMLYGYGELIDKTCLIEQSINTSAVSKSTSNSFGDSIENKVEGKSIVICRNCGAILKPDTSYCYNCGERTVDR